MTNGGFFLSFGDFQIIIYNIINNIIEFLATFWRLFGLIRNDRARMNNYVLLPATVVAVKTSLAARSGVSSFQRTDPNGRSSMRRTRTGSGPI
jgi:hypothetical protein